VLLWHPDKHPTGREAAEEKIRQVNDAYEALSNPFKRSHYDQQLQALERRARGIVLDTTGIKPRMCIPKEFMLSPMGHPEKFVRTVGMSIFVQSRADAKSEFYDFFRDAKFSLWWLPEVNNMCRLRPTSTAGVGQDGGMNFNFFLHRTVNVSEVVLSPGTMPDSANVVAVASPVFKRAFRFEAAQFPGHYLAFRPPNHIRMVGGVVDESTAIDFILVDYTQMFNFITMEEVLTPAVTGLGGEKAYIPLSELRGQQDVRTYFHTVLKKEPWPDEDFESFFSSRCAEWDYDAKGSCVRLRSKHEQLASSLRRSRSLAEDAAAISAASDYDVCKLPLDTLETLLERFGQPVPPMAEVSFVVNIRDSQKKILQALPEGCEKKGENGKRKGASLRRVLDIYEQVSVFGGDKPDDAIAKRRGETARELGDLVSDMIRGSRSGSDMSLRQLTIVCGMPLDWRACGERLAKLAIPLLDREPLEVLLPLLRTIVRALPDSLLLAERLAGLMRKLLRDAKPADVAEALEVMVSGSLCLDTIAHSLERVLRSAPISMIAAVVAGLGELGVEGSDVRDCAAFVGREPSLLEGLPPGLMLRLTVAATKSTAIAEEVLDAVAAAAAITLPGWTTDDASKLLLAVAKAKGGLGGEGVHRLYSRASEVLSTKLHEFSSPQLIKVVLAIGQVPACEPLLEAAAVEASCNRLADLPTAQALLLTQGLLPLGGQHRALERVLTWWESILVEANRVDGLLAESMGMDLVFQRRAEQEAKGQPTADQLAKVAQMLAPVTPNHKDFWKALAFRFIGEGDMEGIAGSLTSAGRAAIDAAFPKGGEGPIFEGKKRMLAAVSGKRDGKDTRAKERKAAATAEEREAERRREREREARSIEREVDRKRELKERARSLERKQEREREELAACRRDATQRSRSRSKRRRVEVQEKSSSSSESSSEQKDPEVKRKREKFREEQRRHEQEEEEKRRLHFFAERQKKQQEIKLRKEEQKMGAPEREEKPKPAAVTEEEKRRLQRERRKNYRNRVITLGDD